MIKRPILLVDDDRDLLTVYKKIMELKEFEVLTADSSGEALKLLRDNNVTVVISDIIMSKMNGMQLLNTIKKEKPNVEVIMLTAEGSISGAVEAVRNGAFSYFVKPANIEELIISIKKAEELALVMTENSNLKQRILEVNEGKEFIGESLAIREIKRKISIISGTDSAVLITGESGTGKEVLANLIHTSSLRKEKPFICVNCSALNENLIESELFGSEKGAFTGAEKQRKGRFELAEGGTIFLDEIGELSLNMQVKLLRVLQEKSFERVGSSKTIKSNFRLITATNKNLKIEVEERRFREDLYYRINIIPIEIPPLRERKEDIPLICQKFLYQHAKEMNKKIEPLEQEVLKYFIDYEWPGNVRELRNILERLVVLSSDGTIRMEDIPLEMKITGKMDNYKSSSCEV